MLLPWIALAAALQPQPDYPKSSPADPVPITITPDNVELDGSGGFDFKPDIGAFNVDPPAGGDGLSFTVRLWFDPTGKPIACDADQPSLPEAAQTGCAQLMRSATFRLWPGMVAPLRRGFVDVQFSFFKDPPGGPAGREMFAQPRLGYRNVPIAYPLDEMLAADRLHGTDGNFSISIGADDYPAIAMRYGLESVSAMQLGISRDGAVKNCRPIDAVGLRTAFLDNYTCALFMRRGRFAFLPDAPKYDGLRYFNMKMRWKIPD